MQASVDIWALGVCIHVWLWGRLPFEGSTPYAMYDAIRNTPWKGPSGCQSGSQGEGASGPPVSDALLSFLRALLCKDARARLSIEQAMAHAWVTQGGAAPMPRCTAGQAVSLSALDRRNAITRTGKPLGCLYVLRVRGAAAPAEFPRSMNAKVHPQHTLYLLDLNRIPFGVTCPKT